MDEKRLEAAIERICSEYVDKLGICNVGRDLLCNYLKTNYIDYSYIQTLVMRDRKKFLKKIYQPLTLSTEEGGISILDGLTVNGYDEEFSSVRLLQIVDVAGMGKSTMTKRMFLDIVEKGTGYPMYVELRRLLFSENLEDEIAVSTIGMNENILRENFRNLLLSGNVIMFLDGYDEIGADKRQSVIEAINAMINKYPQNAYILTSRPDPNLVGFTGFQRVNINPLKKQEAFQLLGRYDENGETSKLLIRRLHDKGYYAAIYDFLKNPLLCSLLFAAFDYKQTIPLKKHLFYSQVYEAYFEKHDLSKGDYVHEKKSGLDIFDFDKVLRIVGFESLKLQKVEYSKDEIEALIDLAYHFCSDLQFEVRDFLYDILHSVPLFSKDGVYFKWNHKSLQEYFAARYIVIDAKERQDTIMTELYNSDHVDKYANLLDILYDLDNYNFHRLLTLPFLKDFMKYYQFNFRKVEGIDDDTIKLRVSLLYERKGYISYTNRKYEDSVFDFILDEWDRFYKMYGERLSQSSGLKVSGLTFCRLLKHKKNYTFINLLRHRNVPIFRRVNKIIGAPDENMRMGEGEFKEIGAYSDFSYSQDAYNFANTSLSFKNDGYFTIIDNDKVKKYAEKIEDMIFERNSSGSIFDGI